MPTRNAIKRYGAEEFYHVYTRGLNKQPLFLDEADYLFFLSLFKRYLSDRPAAFPRHGIYPHYGERVELLAYCLMPNHVHMLIYQKDVSAMTDLLRATMTSYSKYFNRKYKRLGPVFQSRYLASNINRDDYLDHISRYIHLNPSEWEKYPYSSLRYYTGASNAEWIKPGRVLDMFDGVDDYLRFIHDYEGQKQIMDELKWELAAED